MVYTLGQKVRLNVKLNARGRSRKDRGTPHVERLERHKYLLWQDSQACSSAERVGSAIITSRTSWSVVIRPFQHGLVSGFQPDDGIICDLTVWSSVIKPMRID